MTTRSDLDLAWRAFLDADADVDIASYLAPDDDVDAKDLAGLAARARSSDTAVRELATDELVGYLRDARGVTVLDGVLAPALDAMGRHEVALAARVRALPGAPRWHTLATPRLLGNIAYDLLELDRVDEARTWYERALAWDPTNPFACVGLAEALLAAGDADAAFAYRHHLAAFGYPAELCRDFDAAFARTGARPPDVEPYAPDLATLPPLDDVGFARFVTAIDQESHFAPKERLRGHALACWRHGAGGAALTWARVAARVSWWADPERGAIERAWAAAVAIALATRVGDDEVDDVPMCDDPNEPEALAVRVAAAGRGHRAALHDPSGQVRWIAAHALDPDPLAIALLEESARHP